jgi:hypothetical protein
MTIDFRKVLERKNVQMNIDKLAELYPSEKIMLYGASDFSKLLLGSYDFSKLNIVGIADTKFADDFDGEFCGFTKYSPFDLLENDFDIILLLDYNAKPHKAYIKKLFEGEEAKFGIRQIVKFNLIDYAKYIFLG